MKQFVKKSIEKTISYLNQILTKFEYELGSSNIFNSLSPTDNADNVDNYIQSLEWALKNKNRIKNIAISGQYGSGKSSVIKTFIKRNTNRNYKFLNISLATFKVLKDQPNISRNGDNILRLIELSVLQQLFYHEKDNKIPDSRFKKIKSYKTRFLFYYSIGFIAFLVSVLFLIAPNFLAKFSLIEISQKSILFAHYTATLITLVGLFLIIFKSSRALKSLTIKKLNINNAEIEIESGISKSILNNHIDEILYFFEVTNYNVVIIEDLDRFEQTEVFTKLREINLLINNSKKIDSEVVFIYAIKDDMFIDKDRTKFFDFMIPIIPIINSSNSNEKLLDIIKKNNYKISTELIDDISLFIDDMRLLYNIMNEFYIYSKNLDFKLDHQKLLSMIVYKNIYPNDFTQLSENKGNLFQTISNKSSYIKNETSIITKQIEDNKVQIKLLENSQSINLKELRLIYINKIIEQIIATKRHAFYQFVINNKGYSISSMTEEDNFLMLFNGSIDYYYGNASYYHESYVFKFETIENLVNPELGYKEREQLILTSDRIDSLKKQISELEYTKIEIRKSKLSKLISNGLIKTIQEPNKQSELINILLRNGYIDENYLDYISIFYEGSLSKADYQFLINVKIQRSSEFDYKLTKTERLIEKINLFDFEREYILNFTLVDVLLQQSDDFEKKKRLFRLLSSQTANSIDFVDRFIEVTIDIKSFIHNLCKYWPNIWTYIESESVFDDAKKDNYFKLILSYAEIPDLSTIFNSHHSYINNRSDFLQIINDEKKIIQIIETLNLKFNKIDSNSPKSLIDYVYNKNHYSLNKGVIEMLLKHYDKFDVEKFSTSNFSCIMLSSLNSMMDYINANLKTYINSVYLKIESNTEEPIEYYLKLINNENLNETIKEKIIDHVNTKIVDLQTISDSGLWNILFKYSKVSPLWINIIDSFHNEGNMLNENLINFLNIYSNAEELSKFEIPTKLNEEDFSSDLSLSIITEDKITNESYRLITKSIPWTYSDLDFGSITKIRVTYLINNRVINPIIESYNKIKENHNGLNIQLLEEYLEEYIEIVEELELDSSDLELILQSSSISNFQKNVFIKNCTEETINSSEIVLKIISNYLVQNVSFDITDSTIKSILLCKIILPDIRIKIFNLYPTRHDFNFINLFLVSLGLEYQEIVNHDKKATLNKNSLNRQLLNNLVLIGFISSISLTRRGFRINHKRNK